MRPTCSSPIINAVCGLTGHGSTALSAETDYAIRVVAEHARAASVLISDGVAPSNSERGYVLRRIIRRAIRYGRQLGLDRPFMTEVASAVIDRFAAAYPALDENRHFIQRVVGLEENQFLDNIRHGMPLLEDILHFLKQPDANPPALLETAGVDAEGLAAARANDAIPGAVAFVLYDTYGFPPELVDEIGRREYAPVRGHGRLQRRDGGQARARPRRPPGHRQHGDRHRLREPRRRPHRLRRLQPDVHRVPHTWHPARRRGRGTGHPGAAGGDRPRRDLLLRRGRRTGRRSRHHHRTQRTGATSTTPKARWPA